MEQSLHHENGASADPAERAEGGVREEGPAGPDAGCAQVGDEGASCDKWAGGRGCGHDSQSPRRSAAEPPD
ncbi:hypothetical protein GCM10009646_02780 [Streptomyces aureus]